MDELYSDMDIDYFAELYEKYYAQMVLFAEGFLYDRDEAKDVVQDVFSDLWKKGEKPYLYSSEKTYLFACVKNRAINRIKKLNIIDKHQDQLQEAYLFSCQPDIPLDENLKNQIKAILEGMPLQMRSVLELHVFKGLKYAEIADKLGISINSVKTQMKRAFKRFRKEIGLYNFLLFLFFTFFKF